MQTTANETERFVESSLPPSSPSTSPGEGVDEEIPSIDVGRLLLLAAAYVIGTLGIFGNAVVIYVCIRFPLRGITNILVCNQSLIDFFSSFFFLLRYGVVTNAPAQANSALSDFVCKFWISEYPIWALAVASTVNLVYLTIERYIAVFHPIVYRLKLTPFRVKLFAILPWIFGLLHELPWSVTHNVSLDNECFQQWWTPEVGFIIGCIVPVDHYILPLAVIGFVYTRILLKLRLVGPTTEIAAGTARERNNRNYSEKASRNVIKTMFAVSLTYMICWGPNEILYFYSNLGGKVDWNGLFYYYTVVSALCNMCVNPFIYACHYQDFRAKLGKIWRRCRRGLRGDTNGETSEASLAQSVSGSVANT
ncbi:substance-P receptor-like [Amphiura filiformis]|uniref:substance-P receptor-like n=1 Tax=Amphiura filiformis TaxID=82378 RepID=UPI003B20E5B6